ncbi:MAG: IgGFc-binding protein, partial [Myxococcales bacterium]|nr:IgGFc-binding protein [Myxococcales bacterium]
MHSPRLRPSLSLLTVALAIAGCGDTEAVTDSTDSGGETAPTGTASESDPTTSAGSETTAGPTGSDSDTDSTGVDPSTDSETTDPTDPTTETTDPTTETTETTDPTTETTDPTTETTDACVCTPGEPEGVCVEADISVCAEDCMGYEAQPCPQGSACIDGECVENLCNPGSKICVDGESYAVCNDEGDDFDPPVACGDTEGCQSGNCVSLCEQVALNPSSVGCSFIANRMDNYDANQNDSLIVGNTNETKTANVQFYFTPNNSNTEQTQGPPVSIPPGMTYTWTLTNIPPNKISLLRQGGTYRVESDIPTIAYQHSPIGQNYTNDASMLLPEHAMRSNHIIASYPASVGNYPSYFNVIALEDDTTVSWTPRVNT